MKVNYLFPSKFKWPAGILFYLLLALGLFVEASDFRPDVFNITLPALLRFTDTPMGKVVNNNFLNELIGLMAIFSGLVYAFSREKVEDEFVKSIRANALIWAVYTNYILLALFMLLLYDFAFFWAMMLNMFTIIIVFSLRFHWLLYRSNKEGVYEE